MMDSLVWHSRCVGGACAEHSIDECALQIQVQRYLSILIQDDKYRHTFSIYISIFKFAFIFMLILDFYFLFFVASAL
jgi:hypothetical protein